MKIKTGSCIDCTTHGPLIAKRCQNCYWKHRNKVNHPEGKERPKKSAIPAKSSKQIEREIRYAKQRKQWLPLHPHCEAKLDRCTKAATQVHHMQGREGELLFDESKWLAACHNCHTWITEHSAEAIAKGLSLRRNGVS